MAGTAVGWAITDRERAAISRIPEPVWATAIDTNATPRDGAGLAELTGALPAAALVDYPPGTRIIVRRERPHPGAQLDLFEERDGYRYTALATVVAEPEDPATAPITTEWESTDEASYPSTIDVPSAGCWQFTVRWATHEDTVRIEYQ